MTRVDPFAYGLVKPGGDKAPPPAGVEDILFAETGAVKQAPPADSSWGLLDEDVASLLPASGTETAAEDFGADILGEKTAVLEAAVVPPRPRPASMAPRPRAPAAKGMQKPDPVPPREAQAQQGRREVGVRKSPVPASVQVVGAGPAAKHPRRTRTVKVAAPRRLPFERGSPVASVLVPLALFAVGGTSAAWFFAMQQNLVMAGILGGLTLIASAFSWLWLRG